MVLMKTAHALNFFLVGLAMCFSPAYWPEYFINHPNGSGTSDLWLLTMGVTQMTMGAWTMGLNLVPRLTHFLAEWEPITINYEVPDVSWSLPESFYAGLVDEDEINLAHRRQQQLRIGPA